MISLRRFIDWVDTGPGGAADGAPSGLSVALLRALHLLIEGIPLRHGGGPAEEKDRKAVAALLRRLEGPIEPFDVVEVANSALALFEEDAAAAQERQRGEETRSQAAEKQAELARALLKAFRTVLEEHPGGSAGTEKRKQLIRRLEGPLEPVGAFEIAGEALTLWQQEAREAKDRARLTDDDRRSAERQAELAGASLRALAIVLGAAPFSGAASDEPDPPVRHAIAKLRRRCEGQLQPNDVIGVAQEAVAVLEEDAAERRRRRQEQERQAGREGDLSKALLRGLEMLLAALPPLAEGDAGSLGDGQLPVAELCRRLKEPLAADDVAQIVDRAAAALKNDAVTRAQRAARPDALSQALIQALQMLLDGLPLRSGGSNRSEQPARKTIEELHRRLEEPLVPFDVVEIATDALAVFDKDAKAADLQHDAPHVASATDDLLGALREALRIVIGGLPPAADATVRTESHTKRAAAGLLRRLEEPLAPFDVLEIANEALSAMEQDYKAGVERCHLRNEEFQAMIAMLAETVRALSLEKTASLTRLEQIERRIEQASLLEDLRTLKTNLAECLGAVREAAQSQQKQSTETIQRMERQISKARLRLPEQRPESLEAAATPEAAPAEYVVVFLLDRESSIATRFGEDVRQSILRFLNQRLKEALLPADRVVRWKGAAFLASLKRTGTVVDVRAELSSVASVQVPPFVEVGARTIRLPISLSWAVFPQGRFASLEQLFEKVDEFIARAQGGAAN